MLEQVSSMLGNRGAGWKVEGVEGMGRSGPGEVGEQWQQHILYPIPFPGPDPPGWIHSDPKQP